MNHYVEYQQTYQVSCVLSHCVITLAYIPKYTNIHFVLAMPSPNAGLAVSAPPLAESSI